MNARRGHESSRHLKAKKAIAQLFNSSAWSVFIEERNADLIILHHTTCFVVAIEVESSPRNVLNNMVRNIAFGCHAVAVVSLSERYLDQIVNKIFTPLKNWGIKPIKVFLYDEQSLQKLYLWVENLALSSGSDRGKTP
jgi:hypothetical protein